MDLKNLSVEELENLRSEINSLIKEKSIPKYKIDECFINLHNASFGYIFWVFDTEYEIVLNSLSCNRTNKFVSEKYLDNCVFISQEIYDKLDDIKDVFIKNISKFQDDKNKEINTYIKSLKNEFKDKFQELIKDKND